MSHRKWASTIELSDLRKAITFDLLQTQRVNRRIEDIRSRYDRIVVLRFQSVREFSHFCQESQCSDQIGLQCR